MEIENLDNSASAVLNKRSKSKKKNNNSSNNNNKNKILTKNVVTMESVTCSKIKDGDKSSELQAPKQQQHHHGNNGVVKLNCTNNNNLNHNINNSRHRSNNNDGDDANDDDTECTNNDINDLNTKLAERLHIKKRNGLTNGEYHSDHHHNHNHHHHHHHSHNNHHNNSCNDRDIDDHDDVDGDEKNDTGEEGLQKHSAVGHKFSDDHDKNQIGNNYNSNCTTTTNNIVLNGCETCSNDIMMTMMMNNFSTSKSSLTPSSLSSSSCASGTATITTSTTMTTRSITTPAITTSIVSPSPQPSSSSSSSSDQSTDGILRKISYSTLSQPIVIEYKEYESELQMPDIIRLIQKDLSEPYSIYTYRYFIHNWPKLCFLAMHNEVCVGAIVCKLDMHYHNVKRGYIAMLAVDKDYRKLKIGTNLVHKAIQAMFNDNADEVVLETEITNIPALKLYENLGFVRDKRLFHYYLNGVDALRLKLWFR